MQLSEEVYRQLEADLAQSKTVEDLLVKDARQFDSHAQYSGYSAEQFDNHSEQFDVVVISKVIVEQYFDDSEKQFDGEEKYFDIDEKQYDSNEKQFDGKEMRKTARKSMLGVISKRCQSGRPPNRMAGK